MDYEIKQDGDYQYIEEGDGTVLLLLHGLFGALSNFKGVIKHFSKKYKVIVPLLPIFSLPVFNTDIANLSNFVHDFIKFKNYHNIILLGNSLGGHVVLVYTSKHPENIHSIVLTGSSGLYENTFGDGYPRKGDKNYLKEKIKITFYDPKHATDSLVDECFEIVNDRHKLIRTLAFAKSAIRHNMADELPNIQVPACLIWGRDDKITPPKVAEEFKSLLPNADLFWLDKCGHAPMMELPDEFNAILDKWLGKLFGSI
ncbi:MAG: alpha/beta hydrolase [Bacteroidota bacterium]